MAGSTLDPLISQRTIAVEDIGRTLSSMWREADAATPENPGSAVVRARALTLIALGAGSEFSRMANAVNAAVASVPARAVLVELDAEVADGITAEVGMNCAIGGSAGKKVCQESVMLRAAHDRLRDLPSLLVPLAVSDIPLVIYLPSTRELRHPVTTRLLEVADVLVIDSMGCEDVGATFAHLVRIQDVDHVIVRDLSFERLRTWREAIASAYDEVAGDHARVTTVQAMCSNNDAQGSLLLGWIESRFKKDQRPFVRMKKTIDDPAQQGAVCGIDLEIQDSEKRTDVSLRQFGKNVLRLRGKEHSASAELPRALLHEHQALTNVLADPIRDHAYDDALRAVVQRYTHG